MIQAYALLLRWYARSHGLMRKGMRVGIEIVRRALMALGDPSFLADVRGQSLWLPVSHKLPLYAADYPFYDTLITRLAGFIREHEGHLSMVDVGANVGHTILSADPKPGEDFLAIEADSRFAELLRRNLRRLAYCNVTVIEAVCSDVEITFQGKILASNGTARVVRLEEGEPLHQVTLDTLLATYRRVNLIKIDTDGYDFRVLRGGLQAIARHRPAVLFEWDCSNNPGCWDEAQEIFSALTAVGYRQALLYDNLGYIQGLYDLPDSISLRQVWIHQLLRPLDYYDVLVLPAEWMPAFVKTEREFFLEQIRDAGLRSLVTRVWNW